MYRTCRLTASTFVHASAAYSHKYVIYMYIPLQGSSSKQRPDQAILVGFTVSYIDPPVCLPRTPPPCRSPMDVVCDIPYSCEHMFWSTVVFMTAQMSWCYLYILTCLDVCQEYFGAYNFLGNNTGIMTYSRMLICPYITLNCSIHLLCTCWESTVQYIYRRHMVLTLYLLVLYNMYCRYIYLYTTLGEKLVALNGINTCFCATFLVEHTRILCF